MKPNKSTRRKFLRDLGLGALALPAVTSLLSQAHPVQKKKLGVALVGLGGYATDQLAPALLETEHCYLAGIVTGTPSKIPMWQKKYNIPDKNVYNYQTFDSIKDNPDIDIVYVVLPNSMHEEYVVRAAQAGKHVTCEKPMAIEVAACDRMIAACKKAGKKLSVGYRLHFDPYHRELMRFGKEKTFGNLKKLSAGFGFPSQGGVWRLNKELAGGGPLMDVGIYCVQAFCYVTGAEPIAVTAQEGTKTDHEKFKEVEQSLTWQFEMPGGAIAEGKTSYAEGMNYFSAEAESGKFELTSSFGYGGQRGTSSSGVLSFTPVNQQAKQMDNFALAIKNDRPSPVPGEMGRRDVKLLQAIYEAMRTGKRVVL